MTAVAVVLAISLISLSLAGFTMVACWTSISFLCASSCLQLEYIRLRRRGHAMGRTVPEHRSKLDRCVATQWISTGVLGVAASLMSARTDLKPLDVGQLMDALIVAAVVASFAVYVSNLIDWYVLLPKLGGLAGPAPCESPGASTWRYTTCLWYLHRATATAIVYATAVGGTAYLLGGSASQGAKAVYVALGTGFALLAGYFYRELPRAALFSLNPPAHVGDQLYVYVESGGELDAEARKTRRRAYIVDVSFQGINCKILKDGLYCAGRFKSKRDQVVANADAPERRVEDDLLRPQCGPGRCCGVNWYCRYNSKAYD